MPRQHGVTIREVARMCGVSMQTVSRVINDRPDVSPATRSAVEAAIASVGFKPNQVARSLVQRRSRTLGVIAAGLRYFGVAQTLNGITEESQAAGYGLLLREVPGSDDVDLLPVIEFLVAHRVEGIIFAAPELGRNLATVRDRVPAGSPPMIFLKSGPSPESSTIAIDNFGGARLAVGHLVGLGRRRIGHLAGPLDWREARDRHDGWRDAVAAAGLEPGPMVAGTWTSASGEAAFEEMLALDPTIDAVFAGNDQMALGVLRVAHERGIAVPADLAVVGFDGLDEGAQFTPSLTTVRQPLGELGRLAVRRLLADLRDEPSEVSPSGVLATELVIRESAPAIDPRQPTGPDDADGILVGSAAGAAAGPIAGEAR
jgi:LacI family transcriptional regulator